MLCMPRAITFTPGLSGIVGWSIYASIGSHHSAAVLPSDSVKFHHVESYPLVMTNSLPWYRWSIEIDGLPFLKMVDLSMANC